MYYSDTIADPNYSAANSTGDRIGFGDATNPDIRFANGAEATVAEYVLQLVTSSNNSIVEGLGQAVDAVVSEGAEVDPKILCQEGHTALILRRVIGEVATHSLERDSKAMPIPASVIRAAQQMHYGQDAREIGSMWPTSEIPVGLDLEQAHQDLALAITDIAKAKQLGNQLPDPTVEREAWEDTKDKLLTDTGEFPKAA